MLDKEIKKQIRAKRVRSRLAENQQRPRLSVFRSIKHIYAQLIDDQRGSTLLAASDFDLKNKNIKGVAKAKEIGKLVAQKALDKKIATIIFDRGGYKYHGQIKALAEGAREGGLKF